MKRDLQIYEYLLAALAAGAMAACGGGSSTGNGNDSGVTNDASTVGPDEDGDGYPADQDCDDNDPDIYPGRARACQSDCADGRQVCLASGEFTACSAASDCDCSIPGDTRQVACGKCGTGESSCGIDLRWSFPSECQGEGACIPGSLDEGLCEFAGTRTRLCNSECEYLAWDDSGCSGECTPDATEITGSGCADTWERQERRCNSDHTWETVVPCTADCWLTARTGTTDFRDEVCVPAGPFLMGADPGETGSTCDEPEHTVVLSAYFIDVYEVTVARYRDCVQAGGCLEPDWASSNVSVHGA